MCRSPAGARADLDAQRDVEFDRRLGGARHQYLRGELEAALDQQRHGGDVERHRVWIRELLSGYYDPMYDYMLQRRDGPILYQGSRAQVMEYLSHRG